MILACIKKIESKIKLTKGPFITKAVGICDSFNKRQLLKKQLRKESKLTRKDSIDILREFEKMKV